MRTRSTRLHRIYWVMSCHQYLDTDQVSDEYNRRRHSVRAMTEGRLCENMVCIVLIIGSELDMKKIRTACESTYIKLIFSKKIIVLG